MIYEKPEVQVIRFETEHVTSGDAEPISKDPLPNEEI